MDRRSVLADVAWVAQPVDVGIAVFMVGWALGLAVRVLEHRVWSHGVRDGIRLAQVRPDHGAEVT